MLYGIPASLLISGAIFPIGVIIYWVTNNLFTLAQQQWVLRKYPPPPSMTKASKPSGGAGTRSGGGSRSGGGAGKSQVQPVKAGGLFNRAKANGSQPETKPAVEPKALAPKPGAKPVNPKKGRPAKRRG
jgi:YidC/Oxa1 family membrane protein insertase